MYALDFLTQINMKPFTIEQKQALESILSVLPDCKGEEEALIPKIINALENDSSGIVTPTMLNEMKEFIEDLKEYTAKSNPWYGMFNN